MENVISVAAAMEMCDDDEDFLKEMIEIMRDDIFACEDLFRQKDTTHIKEVSHRVKGQAACLGAKDLWEKSKKLEDAAKDICVTRTEYLQLMLSMKEFVRCTRNH